MSYDRTFTDPFAVAKVGVAEFIGADSTSPHFHYVWRELEAPSKVVSRSGILWLLTAKG